MRNASAIGLLAACGIAEACGQTSSVPDRADAGVISDGGTIDASAPARADASVPLDARAFDSGNAADASPPADASPAGGRWRAPRCSVAGRRAVRLLYDRRPERRDRSSLRQVHQGDRLPPRGSGVLLRKPTRLGVSLGQRRAPTQCARIPDAEGLRDVVRGKLAPSARAAAASLKGDREHRARDRGL